MNYNGRRIIARVHLERKYEQLGLTDYKLRNLQQLREIHGVDVTEISGYDILPEMYKNLFDKAIINFYNVNGLENRNELAPKSINYVCEQSYYISNQETNMMYSVGREVYVLNADGSIRRRLHRYVFEKGISFKGCKTVTSKAYLRFELKGEWYHIMGATKWY